jgi:hypothetical protein
MSVMGNGNDKQGSPELEQWAEGVVRTLRRDSRRGSLLYMRVLYRPVWCYEIVSRKMKSVGPAETMRLIALKGPSLVLRRFK